MCIYTHIHMPRSNHRKQKRSLLIHPKRELVPSEADRGGQCLRLPLAVVSFRCLGTPG